MTAELGRQVIRCDGRLELQALPGLPLVGAGDDLAALLAAGLLRASIALRDGDILVVVSKVVSRAEGRFVDLTTVEPSDRARALALETGKDARLCELILGESLGISRSAPGALLVRHAPAAVADAFCASRLGGDWGNAYGTLPPSLDFASIIERVTPKIA